MFCGDVNACMHEKTDCVTTNHAFFCQTRDFLYKSVIFPSFQKKTQIKTVAVVLWPHIQACIENLCTHIFPTIRTILMCVIFNFSQV